MRARNIFSDKLKAISFALIAGSVIFFVQVSWITWYDITVWNKDLGTIFFGSRSGEAMSLGIGITNIHYLLFGIFFLVSGLGLFYKIRIGTVNTKQILQVRKKNHGERRLLRRLLGEMRPYLLYFALIFVVSLSSIPLTLITPYSLKIIVDSVLSSQPLPSFMTTIVPGLANLSKDYLIALAIGILLATTVFIYLQSLLSIWLNNKIGNRVTLEMRARLFRAMQRLSIAYHDKKGTTDSTYSIQYDAPSFQWFTIDDLIPLVTSILTVVGMVVVMIFLDWQLALVALLVTPLFFGFTLVYQRRLRKQWRQVKTSESAAMSVVQESLTAIRIVKAFGQEEHENERFVSRSSESAKAALRVYLQGGIYDLSIGVVTAIGIAAVLFFGIRHVQFGILSLGELLILNYYLTQLYSPMKTIGSKVLSMQRSLAGVERFFAVLDEKPDVPEHPNARPLERAAGKITFESVSFEYEKGHPVLQDVSFVLPTGTRLGVIGPSGSGKTTLSSLILRFFDPTEGAIKLDDVNFMNYKIADLRNQFAVVQQDALFFSTTVSENIRFARPGATFDEIIAAAKGANAHDFITHLPKGYDTLVGERGMRLSGGERQRISLARAFLKDAPILILDEPTSSLDTQAEKAVLNAIERLMRGRTTLMIAHRVSTLRNCDVLLILENGKVSKMTTEVASVIRDILELGTETLEKKELLGKGVA